MDQVVTSVDSLSPARRNVLIALKEKGEACADDLADALGISASAVRQHLTGLRSAGYVETRPGRGRPGRPVDWYHSTSRGDALFGPHDDSFTLELLGDMEAEDPELVDRVLHRRQERRTEAYREAVAGLDVEGRLLKLSELLDAEGYLTRVEPRDDGSYVLRFNNCAIWSVAERYRLVCTTELAFLQSVLGDVQVERIVHRHEGSFHCGYEIRP